MIVTGGECKQCSRVVSLLSNCGEEKFSLEFCDNQSEVGIVLCQPIRDQYCTVSTNQNRLLPEVRKENSEEDLSRDVIESRTGEL